MTEHLNKLNTFHRVRFSGSRLPVGKYGSIESIKNTVHQWSHCFVVKLNLSVAENVQCLFIIIRKFRRVLLTRRYFTLSAIFGDGQFPKHRLTTKQYQLPVVNGVEREASRRFFGGFWVDQLDHPSIGVDIDQSETRFFVS